MTKIWDFIEEWWTILLPVTIVIAFIAFVVMSITTVYINGETGKTCGCKVSGKVFVGEDLYVCNKVRYSSVIVYVNTPKEIEQ